MSDGYRVAVVGATGAVGTEMRRQLRKREFPAREIVPFASERSAGRELDGAVVQPLTPGDGQGLRPGAVLGRRRALEGVGAALPRRRRRRRGQLVGLAHGPRGPARRRRGQPRGARRAPRHRRQPELRGHGPRAAAARARPGLRPGERRVQLLPGRGRRGAEGHRRARRPGGDPRPGHRPARHRRLDRAPQGAAQDPRGHAGLQRRAAARRRGGKRLHRRGDEAQARVAQDPRAARAARLAHVRAGAGDGRALDRGPGHVPGRGRPRGRPARARRLPGHGARPRPHAARVRRPRRGRGGPRARRPRRPPRAELLRRRRQPAQGRCAEQRPDRRGPARAGWLRPSVARRWAPAGARSPSA